MLRLNHKFVTLVFASCGASFFVAFGCERVMDVEGEPVVTVVQADEESDAGSDDGGKTGGTNSLLPADLNSRLDDLRTFFAVLPLRAPGSIDAFHPQIEAALRTSSAARELAKRVVQCVAPPSITLTMPLSGGGTFSATGEVGLASVDKALTRAVDQEFVTACLIQKLNMLGAVLEVTFQFRNENAPSGDLTFVAPGEPTGTFTESAAGGNLFKDHPKAWVCARRNLADACSENTSSQLKYRVCGTDSSCAIDVLGACESNPDCSYSKGGWKCKYDGRAWGNTIMRYMKPEDVVGLYGPMNAAAAAHFGCDDGCGCTSP